MTPLGGRTKTTQQRSWQRWGGHGDQHRRGIKPPSALLLRRVWWLGVLAAVVVWTHESNRKDATSEWSSKSSPWWPVWHSNDLPRDTAISTNNVSQRRTYSNFSERLNLSTPVAAPLSTPSASSAAPGEDSFPVLLTPPPVSRNHSWNIAFLGDSVTRYQYLSLVYFLHTGEWLVDSKHCILISGNRKTWEGFYFHTNRRLHEREICDCFREEEGVSPPRGNRTFDPERIFENRYYRDPRFRNSVTYIQKFGLYEAHGHHWPHTLVPPVARPPNATKVVYGRNRTNAPAPIIPKRFLYRPPLWSYNWTAVVREHLGRLVPRPRIVFINAGMWENDLSVALLRELRAALTAVGMIGVYKMTNFQQDGTLAPDVGPEEEYCRILHYCYNATRAPFPASAYADYRHFNARTYRYLNEALLQQVTDIEAAEGLLVTSR